MHGSQQRKQVKPPELSRSEFRPLATGRAPLPSLIDELIGNMWFEQIEKCGCACSGQKGIHAPEATLLERVRPRKEFTLDTFEVTN
jgi:hypothetical protein